MDPLSTLHKSCVRLRMPLHWVFRQNTRSRLLSQPWLRINWRKETLAFTRGRPLFLDMQSFEVCAIKLARTCGAVAAGGF